MIYSLQDDSRHKPRSKKDVLDNPLISSIYKTLDTAGYLI